jgi:hypothetical protein
MRKKRLVDVRNMEENWAWFVGDFEAVEKRLDCIMVDNIDSIV